MRTGPSVEQLTRPATMVTHVESHLGRDVLASHIPVLDGEVTFDGKRDAAGALDITVPAAFKPKHERSPLAAWGQILHVEIATFIHGAEFNTNVGRFRIQEWEEQSDGTIRLRALDLMQDLVDSPAPYPTSPPAGGSLHAEARRLAHPVSVVMHTADTSLPGLSWGVNRVENLRELGKLTRTVMRMEADGKLHVYPQRTGLDVAAIYTARDLLLARDSRGVRDQYTAVTAWGKPNTTDKDAPPMMATVNSTDPRLSAAAYGPRVKIVQVETATSQAHLQEYANNVMRTQSAEAGKTRVEIVADPRLELYDAIAVHHGDTIVVGEVQGIVLPLNGGSMRVDLVELRF